MAKLINVEIDEQGGLSVDLIGFHGKGCKDVAKVFQSLGKTTKEITKPEAKETNLGVIRK